MKAYYNGCEFESVHELRFALSIEDAFAYLLHPRRIFNSYYRENGSVVAIEDTTSSYKPDFLIRSYSENTVSFFEIKPHGFNDWEQYSKRNRIMNNFQKQLDLRIEFQWHFGLASLSEEKLRKFQALMKNQAYEKKFFLTLDKLYPGRNKKIPFTIPAEYSTSEYFNFVVHGEYPTHVAAKLSDAE